MFNYPEDIVPSISKPWDDKYNEDEEDEDMNQLVDYFGDELGVYTYYVETSSGNIPFDIKAIKKYLLSEYSGFDKDDLDTPKHIIETLFANEPNHHIVDELLNDVDDEDKMWKELGHGNY